MHGISECSKNGVRGTPLALVVIMSASHIGVHGVAGSSFSLVQFPQTGRVREREEREKETERVPVC